MFKIIFAGEENAVWGSWRGRWPIEFMRTNCATPAWQSRWCWEGGARRGNGDFKRVTGRGDGLLDAAVTHNGSCWIACGV